MVTPLYNVIMPRSTRSFPLLAQQLKKHTTRIWAASTRMIKWQSCVAAVVITTCHICCQAGDKFFLWTAYNAYVIQHCFCSHKQPGKRLKTFHMFVDKLLQNLVGTCTLRITSRHVSDPSEVRLLNEPSAVFTCQRDEQVRRPIAGLLFALRNTSKAREQNPAQRTVHAVKICKT